MCQKNTMSDVFMSHPIHRTDFLYGSEMQTLGVKVLSYLTKFLMTYF